MGSPPRPKWPAGDATTPAAGAGPAALPLPPAVGVVLAGGASRRMGRDKATLDAGLDGSADGLSGRTLAEWSAARLRRVCGEVVVADAGRGLVAGLPSLADGPGGGPAAGILGAAAAFPGRALLVLACDLPAVPGELLAALLERRPGPPADWVVPRWRRQVEPLCALYEPAALAELAAGVARGVDGPRHLTDSATLSIRYVEGRPLRRCGLPGEMFLNLNTPAELARWRERLAGAAAGDPVQV